MAVTSIPESEAPERPVTVYEATRTGLPPLRPYLRSLWASRALIWELTRAQIKAEHYDTFFGQVWLVLNPLLLALVYLLLRIVIRPLGHAEERNYLVAHLITGVFFFHWVMGMLNRGTRSILANSRFILNTAVPRAAFPIQTTLRELLDFLPSLVVLFALHALLRQPWGWALLWLPVLMAAMATFSLGLSFLCSALTVFFRDTANFMSYLTRIWFFATPIIFTVSEIPDHLYPWFRLNPLFTFFALLDELMRAQPPSLGWSLGCLAWTTVAFVGGGLFFLAKEREFAVRL